MKKILCYDTNDAANGKINVSANGVLRPDAVFYVNVNTLVDADGNHYIRTGKRSRSELCYHA